MTLRTATRQKAKIRLGLSAVSGGGKTYSALLIAYGLCGDWAKIAVIDTENSSADLYAHLGPYNVLPLEAPYPPEKYIEAVTACEKAGMEVVVIDSISHEWDGNGGCLEIHEQLGGKYQDWAKVTPRHRAFIEKLLSSKCHIVTTVRRKQDYEMTKDNNGKVKVEKAGLKEVTREGWEYELTVNLELDTRHIATAGKDRTGLFMDKPSFVPTVETGIMIREWCESGSEPIAEPVVQAQTAPPPRPIADVSADTYNSARELAQADGNKEPYKGLPCQGSKYAGKTIADIPDAEIESHIEQTENFIATLKSGDPKLATLRAYVKCLKDYQLPF